MNKLDFNTYDVKESINYDGFIDLSGNFYRVKIKNGDDIFNDWAAKYMEKNRFTGLQFQPSYSMLLSLTKIKSSIELLVNCYGFVYYNHIDDKPIVMLPNPHIAGNRVAPIQLESLIEIMKLNNENPIDKEFIIDANKFYYNGLDGGKMK